MPMIPFIGVRISWLMFARNMPFATLAPSARSFDRASSSCTWRRSADLLLQARVRLLAVPISARSSVVRASTSFASFRSRAIMPRTRTP